MRRSPRSRSRPGGGVTFANALVARQRDRLRCAATARAATAAQLHRRAASTRRLLAAWLRRATACRRVGGRAADQQPEPGHRAARPACRSSPSTLTAGLQPRRRRCLRDLARPAPVPRRRRCSAASTRRGATATWIGKPAIIVHGRADALLPVNHTSRPYYRAQQARRKAAQHAVVHRGHERAALRRLHRPARPCCPATTRALRAAARYLNRALDADLRAPEERHSRCRASQVLRTMPRGGTPGAAPAISAANVPASSRSTPAAPTRSRCRGRTLRVSRLIDARCHELPRPTTCDCAGRELHYTEWGAGSTPRP